MNKFVAKRLMAELMRCYEALETAERIAESMGNNEAKISVIKGILMTATELEEGAMLPILKKFPDLSPFSDGRPRTF